MLDARDLPDGQRLTADVCIVGGGAAGIALAMEMIGTGIDVLLLESGGLRSDRAADDLNVGSVADPRLNSAPDLYRRRRFGGFLNEQDLRLTTLNADTFESTAYSSLGGWPISSDALSPFYLAAMKLCESDESQRSPFRDAESIAKPMIPGLEGEHFSAESVDRLAHRTHFGARFEAALRASSNVCALLNATVTRLQMNADGTAIESVMARTLVGKSIHVKATRFVLAAGALETARLLLANRDVHQNGIGNDTDSVGRFLLCPIEGSIPNLELAQPPNTAWLGSDHAGQSARSRRVLTLKPETRRRLQVGAFAARLRQQGNAGASRSPLRRKSSESARGGVYTLDFQAEQQPLSSSRVTLGDSRDALGMPRLIVDWNCSIADFETVRRSIGLLASDLARAGAGRLEYDASSLAAMMTCLGSHGANQLGTTRMGSDPRTSVVDGNCRVHGVNNLFIAGSGVFPTSGLGDPMLTMIALSLRLADHIKKLELRVVHQDRKQPRLTEVRPPVRLVAGTDQPDRRRA